MKNNYNKAKFEILHNDLNPSIDDITELIFNGVYNFTIDKTNVFTFTKDKCCIDIKYYDELNNDTIDEVNAYIRNYGLKSFDVYEEHPFNGKYSIISVRESKPVNILKYGIYQQCVDNYFKRVDKDSMILKSDRISSWDKLYQIEILKESLKEKPIHKNSLFFK